MKVNARAKYGSDWWLHSTDTAGDTFSADRIQIILLQEIRDELQRLNALLYCANFTGIPHTLKTIAKQTKKAERKRSTSTTP